MRVMPHATFLLTCLLAHLLLGQSFAHALVKTVKLWERPTPYELIKQLEVVREKLPEIYDSGTTLNIWLERESSTPG